jgi:hypothetical protein
MFSELDADGNGTIEWSKRWSRRVEGVRGKVGEKRQADACEYVDSIAFGIQRCDGSLIAEIRNWLLRFIFCPFPFMSWP